MNRLTEGNALKILLAPTSPACNNPTDTAWKPVNDFGNNPELARLKASTPFQAGLFIAQITPNIMQITITTTQHGVQSVDARHLHEILEVKTRFNDWISTRTNELGFTNGIDFMSFTENPVKPPNGRPAIGYALTLEMAKHIAMIERNEKGRQVRQYFIDFEKKNATPIPMALPTHSEALRGWANALEVNEAQAAQIEAQTEALAIAEPKVEFHDTVTASETVCQLAVACQVAKLKFGRNTLYRKLRKMGVLIDGGHRHNLPMQDYIKRGIFTVEESKYNHPHTDEPIIKFTTHATQRGVAWLIKTFRGITEIE